MLRPWVHMLPEMGWCGRGFHHSPQLGGLDPGSTCCQRWGGVAQVSTIAHSLVSTCCQRWGGVAQVFVIAHSLVVVDSSCSHNWCLCCHQMGQSWRMWWTVCSASLQSQSAEVTVPVCFLCTCKLQCPVGT